MNREKIVEHGVRKIETWTVVLRPTDGEEEPQEDRRFMSEEQLFDEHGNILKHVTLDPNGEIEGQEAYRYDDDQRMVYREETDAHGMGQRFSYVYDDEGQIVERHTLYDEGDDDVCRYEYENGNLIEKKTMGEDGEEESREVFEYNESADMTAEEEYSYGSLLWRREYDWEDGKRTADRGYDEDRRLVSSGTRTYSDEGKLLSILVKNERFPTESSLTEYSYHEDGSTAEVLKKDVYGNPVQKQSHEYDENGLLSSITMQVEQPGMGVVYLKREHKYMTEA